MKFDPDHNSLLTQKGIKVDYEALVVCPGIQIDWDRVKGLKDALGVLESDAQRGRPRRQLYPLFLCQISSHKED